MSTSQIIYLLSPCTVTGHIDITIPTFIDPRGRCGYQLSNTLVQCAGAISLNRTMIYRLVIAGRQVYISHYRIACLPAFCRVKKRVVSSFFISFYGSYACSAWHHILSNSFLLLPLQRNSEQQVLFYIWWKSILHTRHLRGILCFELLKLIWKTKMKIGSSAK